DSKRRCNLPSPYNCENGPVLMPGQMPVNLFVLMYGTDRSRTDDLLRVKQALFQLSYDPARIVSTVYINTVFPSPGIWPSSGQVISLPTFSIAIRLPSPTTCV